MLPAVALVGRPNVGKSTLFNRLVGRKLAIVDDRPGVTRDLREGAARLGSLKFTVLDTAGLEDVTDDSLAWPQVTLIFVVILATVVVSEWVSAKVRHAFI
jgi:small GTP-binding protein